MDRETDEAKITEDLLKRSFSVEILPKFASAIINSSGVSSNS